MAGIKFDLDSLIIYKGKAGTVWDYSARYNDYEIRVNGSKIRNVHESELTAAGTQTIIKRVVIDNAAYTKRKLFRDHYGHYIRFNLCFCSVEETGRPGIWVMSEFESAEKLEYRNKNHKEKSNAVKE